MAPVTSWSGVDEGLNKEDSLKVCLRSRQLHAAGWLALPHPSPRLGIYSLERVKQRVFGWRTAGMVWRQGIKGREAQDMLRLLSHTQPFSPMVPRYQEPDNVPPSKSYKSLLRENWLEVQEERGPLTSKSAQDTAQPGQPHWKLQRSSSCQVTWTAAVSKQLHSLPLLNMSGQLRITRHVSETANIKWTKTNRKNNTEEGTEMIQRKENFTAKYRYCL